MMVKVLLFGYCTGVASSRRLALRLHEDIAFRVLAANNTPDLRTVSDFRKDHLAALSELFVQVLALCQQAGLVKLGHVALDGAKVKANSSKHKAMSYGRMKEKEAQLAAEVAELLRRAQEVDDEEDHRYGRDKRGDELPEELAIRESRLRKIREAKAALEAEARAAAEQAEAEGRQHPGNLPWVPGDKEQRNFTDPESRIMPMPGGRDFQQAYNCQAVADSAHSGDRGGPGHQPAVGQGTQAVSMIEQTTSATPARCPRRYPPTRATTRQGPLMNSMPWEWTRSSRRRGPATARQYRWLPRGRIPANLSARDRMRRKPADETGTAALRVAQTDGGAGVRADQAGARPPAVPAAELGKGKP